MTEPMAWLVPALATALLHFLWQGALVGLLAWFALALLRGARPQARYAVASLALLACAVLPAWNLVQAVAGADAVPMARLALGAGGDGGVASTTTPGAGFLAAPTAGTLRLLVALWAAGVCTLTLRLACGLSWVRRLRRDARAEAGRWQASLDALVGRMGIARPVALRLMDEGESPVTAGWWRPVVLLPAAVAASMPVELVEALLAHELAHVRRHDYLVNLLQSAVEALLFYHPVVWWLSHRIRVERELVADDLAAAALGDRRRLALALSELDRLAARSPALPPHFAPAAHGGHLMSRIHRLLRPERRATGAAIVLPAIGLVLAGAAFYAHARLATPDATSPASAPAAIAQALPAPAARPGARVLPAPDARPAPATPDRSPYALVRADRDGITLSGDLDDADEIRLVRGRVDGDFLWFRRDGKAWVVRDPAILARVREAWAGTDALGEKMQALEARMAPHGARMEALAERMQALDDDNVFESPEARTATERMEALGEQAEALAGRQLALAARMEEATLADQQQLERDRQALEREQQALHGEMQRHGATLQALNARMEAMHAPMEALAREMEAASQPMEAIGKDMEALGERIEREAEVAEAQVHRLIDEAWRSGRAEPAPARQ